MRGETLGIVGESGSGKSTLALTILRLLPPAARIASGRMLFEGEDLLQKSDAEMRRVRGKRIAMILQDPMASLNPLFTIGDQVAEPIRVHEGVGRARPRGRRARELLKAVRIPSPQTRLHQHPHEMSGGMRQRIVGAIGISCEPRLLIADEPTTSLDLTIQAQYLNLLRELQRAHGLALIFITHNLGIVAKMCDQLAVMYAGRVVESGPVRQIFNSPAHPYTKALLNSIPRMSDSRQRLTAIDGQPPDLAALPPGCAFAPRCPSAFERCREAAPPELTFGDGRTVRCWLAARGCRRSPTSGAGRSGLMAVLEAAGLSKHFRARRGLFGGDRGVVRAVDGISFAIEGGQTLGVVGESGCGKTTTAKLVLGLEEPTGGGIRFEGRDLQALDAAGRRHYRKSVQAVFQDPYASLNPRMRVGAIIAEPLVTNEQLTAGEVRRRVLRAARPCRPAEPLGGPLPARVLGRPAPAHRHRPRAGAVAQAGRARRARLRPRRVDPRPDPEPAARPAGRSSGLSYLFIAHDLAAVAHMSHAIVVMYLGRIVESGEAQSARAARRSIPTPQALFSAALPSSPDERRDEIVLAGEVPSPLRPPPGCHFHPRCPQRHAALPRTTSRSARQDGGPGGLPPLFGRAFGRAGSGGGRLTRPAAARLAARTRSGRLAATSR